MEEHGTARLPAANQAGRFADRRRLSCRYQQPSGVSGAGSRLWRRGWQGYGEPGVAEGETDWDARNNARALNDEPTVRLIFDGTVVGVRLDRKATAIPLLVVLGVREDGQKVLLAVKNMGGETSQAWRTVLDDLVKRGLRKPEFLIVDGATGLEQALAALWGDVPTQRCTVHKHRNLLAHAPQRLHNEISADYNDMVYATSAAEIEQRRRAFIRKWRPNARRSLTASRRRVTGSSPLHGCRLANGRARVPPMP